MIKTALITLRPTTSAFGLWVECALAGRITAYIGEFEGNDRGELSQAVREEVNNALERLLYVGGFYRIMEANGEEEYQGVLNQFDEATGLALISVTLNSSNKEEKTFSARFGLPPGKLSKGSKEGQCFIVVQIPKRDTAETITAVAIALLDDHSWDGNIYSIPSWKRREILAAAQEVLPVS